MTRSGLAVLFALAVLHAGAANAACGCAQTNNGPACSTQAAQAAVAAGNAVLQNLNNGTYSFVGSNLGILTAYTNGACRIDSRGLHSGGTACLFSTSHYTVYRDGTLSTLHLIQTNQAGTQWCVTE